MIGVSTTTDRELTEEELRVLRAYGLRDIPVERIAEVQALSLDRVKEIITVWARDDREQARAVLRGESPEPPAPPLKKKRTRPSAVVVKKEASPVSPPPVELQDAPPADAAPAPIETVPVPAVVDDVPPPEGAEVIESLTGSQILALLRDASNSPTLATRQVGRRIQVLIAELVQALNAERLAEEERAAREEIAEAARALTKTLESVLARLREGAVDELVREWALLNGWTPPEGSLPVDLVRAYFRAQSRGPSLNGA